MTPDDLYKTVLLVLKQVRKVHAERLKIDQQDWPMSVPMSATPEANDAMLDDMARNAAQALVVLIDCAGGGPCPKCGSSYIGPAQNAGPCCSLCGAVQ